MVLSTLQLRLTRPVEETLDSATRSSLVSVLKSLMEGMCFRALACFEKLRCWESIVLERIALRWVEGNGHVTVNSQLLLIYYFWPCKCEVSGNLGDYHYYAPQPPESAIQLVGVVLFVRLKNGPTA